MWSLQQVAHWIWHDDKSGAQDSPTVSLGDEIVWLMLKRGGCRVDERPVDVHVKTDAKLEHNPWPAACYKYVSQRSRFMQHSCASLLGTFTNELELLHPILYPVSPL